jgi:hypothetical protein
LSQRYGKSAPFAIIRSIAFLPGHLDFVLAARFESRSLARLRAGGELPRHGFSITPGKKGDVDQIGCYVDRLVEQRAGELKHNSSKT